MIQKNLDLHIMLKVEVSFYKDCIKHRVDGNYFTFVFRTS